MTASFYKINFEKEFLQKNFDNLLRESNSKLVNENIYLNVKNKYFEKTIKNYELFKQEKEELDKLLSSEIYYIDIEQRISYIKNNIKNIIIEQRLAYQNFFKHIMFLKEIK